jgi:group I intron endonuclease
MKVIYCVINKLTNKVYVGKTNNNKDNYYGSGKYITNSLKKYGKENFLKIILDTYIDDEWVEKEKNWINILDSKVPNGYNIVDGGMGTEGLVHTEVAKKKIAEASKKRVGRIFTKEHKENIGKFRKGRSYVEIFGKEKAEKLIENKKRPMEEKWTEDKIKKYRIKTCLNYEEKYGTDKSKEIKQKKSKSMIGKEQSETKKIKCSKQKIGKLNPQYKEIHDDIKNKIVSLFHSGSSIREISKISGISGYKITRFLVENNIMKDGKVTWVTSKW